MDRKPPAVYELDGRWYAKIKYPVGHSERAAGWRNVPTGETHQARALLAAEQMRDRVERGLPATDPAAPVVALMTVSDLVKVFLREYSRRRIKDLARYRKSAREVFNWIVLPYLGQHAAALRRADIFAYVATLRQQGYSGASINQGLTFLSSLYTFATERELVTAHPCRNFEREAAGKSEEHLSVDECQAFLRMDLRGLTMLEIMTWYAAACCLYGGQRSGELAALRLDDVDFNAQTILVQHNWTADRSPKSGKARTIPLHPELAIILKPWHAERTAAGAELLCGPQGKDGRVDRLRRLLKRARAHDLGPRPWHALRHTFATHMHAATGNLDAVARILGHATTAVLHLGDPQAPPAPAAPQVTSRYVHPGVAYMARELDKLSYGMRRAEVEPRAERGKVLDLSQARARQKPTRPALPIFETEAAERLWERACRQQLTSAEAQYRLATLTPEQLSAEGDVLVAWQKKAKLAKLGGRPEPPIPARPVVQPRVRRR